MHLEQKLEFIDSLVMPTFSSIRTFANLPDQPEPNHNTNNATASVMPETIDAFLPGVSQPIIDDVNLCKLIMQNAAKQTHPDNAFEQYKYYVNGLTILGWVIQSNVMKEITIRKIGLTMDQVALETAKELIGSAGAGVLAKVATMAVNAAKNDKQAVDIFNYGTVTGKQAKFDLSPVWVDKSGQPNMILNFTSLDAKESKSGFLFWKSTTQSTTVSTGATHSYLDMRSFADVRNELREKAGLARIKLIKKLPDFKM